jgi:large subunit ribosomal protein L25
VDFNDFKKVWKAAGESTVIDLELQPTSGVGCIPVLIYGVDMDPLSNEPRHVDFYAVDMAQKIIASVPLVFTGEAPAIKLGGTLVKVIHEVEVEAMPKDLPSELEADMSGLKTFEDKISAADIKVPAGVKILAEPTDVVVLVEEAKEESFDKDKDKEEAPSIEEIEVIKEKGKEEAKEETGEKSEAENN